MFLLPHSSETRIEDMMGGGGGGGGEHENDIKWPNGLSFFNALTGRTDDVKLLFNPENLGSNKPDNNQNQHHPLILEGRNPNPNSDNAPNMQNAGAHGNNPNEVLSLDSATAEGGRKNMDQNKFKRSFTLPARMASSSSSTSVEHHHHQQVEYRNSEAGMYPDVMDTFLQ